jgi:hypothetical protein
MLRDIEQVYDLYKLPQKQEPRYKKRRADNTPLILPAGGAFGKGFSREFPFLAPSREGIAISIWLQAVYEDGPIPIP